MRSTIAAVALAPILLAPAATHADPVASTARLGFPRHRLHVEWRVPDAPADLLDTVRAWTYDEVAGVYLGRQVTCAIGGAELICAIEIDRKGRARAPASLIALGEVAHPTRPITGEATIDVSATPRIAIAGAAGVLIWAWADARRPAHLRCETDNAAGAQQDARCGFRVTVEGRVRAAAP